MNQMDATPQVTPAVPTTVTSSVGTQVSNNQVETSRSGGFVTFRGERIFVSRDVIYYGDDDYEVTTCYEDFLMDRLHDGEVFRDVDGQLKRWNDFYNDFKVVVEIDLTSEASVDVESMFDSDIEWEPRAE